MAQEDLLRRITLDPKVCGGTPCIKSTRIPVAVVLDSLAEGLTPEQIINHFPNLGMEDIRASLAYAAELSRESVWKIAAGS